MIETMVNEKRRKKGKEPVQDEATRKMTLDPKTHRRLLRFLNAARAPPEDLAFAPLNEIKSEPQETLKRPDVDEPMQERPRKKLIDFKQARRILEERDKVSPLHGFIHLDQREVRT
jgi:hypothetical protein